MDDMTPQEADEGTTLERSEGHRDKPVQDPLGRWSRVWPSTEAHLMALHKRIRRKSVFFSLFPLFVLFPLIMFSLGVSVYMMFFEIVLGIAQPVHYVAVVSSLVVLVLSMWLWQLSQTIGSTLYMEQSVIDRELNSL